MCIEAMDTGSNRIIKPDCLRKAMKPGSKLRWKLPRVFSVEDKQSRSGAVRTIRKYLRREQKRVQLAQLARVLVGGIGKKEKRESVVEESPAEAYTQRQPLGAMAPQNTTQYIMENVYEDMKTSVQTVPASQLDSESISPRDSDYEGCLAFQQRDFEEAFNLWW